MVSYFYLISIRVAAQEFISVSYGDSVQTTEFVSLHNRYSYALQSAFGPLLLLDQVSLPVIEVYLQ